MNEQQLSWESCLNVVKSNPQLNTLLLPKWSKYIPHKPEPKQQAFLWLDDLEAFYGGAAGSMKSDTMLMAALQYVDIPGYNAVILRDTYANLNKPEGLMTRAHSWLKNTDAHWNGEAKRYEFPSGATLSFSYLDGPLDHFNHQGAEYQFVGIDEIVNIRENQAIYMFSRLRIKEPESYKEELKTLTDFSDKQIEGYYQQYRNIPLRFRAAANPPTREQLAKGSWVKSRYIDEETREDRVFMPANLLDNPHVDHEKYIASLNKLDPITRAQLLEGDWNIRVKGRMFDRSWFPIVDQAPIDVLKVRFWDPAHTEKTKPGQDPDFFSGARMSITSNGLVFIENIRRFQKSPLNAKKEVLTTAKIDGRLVHIIIEREPAAGTTLVDDYIRLLAGFTVRGALPKGSKIERAEPFASYAEAGNVYLVNGHWIEAFLDELEVFPDGQHDDQVDCVSGGFGYLTGKGRVNMRWV